MFIKIPPKEELLPPPISPGIYRASSQAKVSKTPKGDPMIVVEFTITSQGPNPSEKTIGRKVYENLPVMEKTLWKIAATVKALTGQDLPEGDVNLEEFCLMLTSALSNRDAMLKIDVENYEGKKNNKVKEIIAA